MDNTSLLNHIKGKINTTGPMTFAGFMEIALYHEKWGYYTNNAVLGRHGDFYTSSHVSPIFGLMLARQLNEMWTEAGKPNKWELIEYGPGEGLLARDILMALQKEFPDLFTSLRYRAMETSPALAARQRDLWKNPELHHANMSWIKNLDEVSPEPFHGCIFSNELVDAFPVHIVRQTRDGLKELYVMIKDDQLKLVTGEPSTHDLDHYFARQGITLAEGQTAEVNLNAFNWLMSVANHINKGFIIIIDYGALAEELYSQARFDGTLRCFHQHQLKTSPLKNIGQQDITASVNFTALQKWGIDAGLCNLGTISQSQFLINLGILDELKPKQEYSYDPALMKKTMAVKQLIMPEGMGQTFKVLIQSKGFKNPPTLSGMRAGRGI